MNRYKIVLFQDNTYEVIGYKETVYTDNGKGIAYGLEPFDYGKAEGFFQGGYDECVAYITARENGWI